MNSMTSLFSSGSDLPFEVRLSYQPGRLPNRPWVLNISKLSDHHVTIHDLSMAEIEHLGRAILAAVERERNVDRIQAEKQSDK